MNGLTVYAQRTGDYGLLQWLCQREPGKLDQYGVWSCTRKAWVQRMRNELALYEALLDLVVRAVPIELTNEGLELFNSREEAA